MLKSRNIKFSKVANSPFVATVACVQFTSCGLLQLSCGVGPVCWGVGLRRTHRPGSPAPTGVCTCSQNPSVLECPLCALGSGKAFQKWVLAALRSGGGAAVCTLSLLSQSLAPCTFVYFFRLWMLLLITWIVLVYVPSSVVLLNITSKETVFLFISVIIKHSLALCHLFSWPSARFLTCTMEPLIVSS